MSNSRYGIFYEGRDPCFYVRDPELIKRITVTDFDHFSASTFFISAEMMKMKVNKLGIATSYGNEWRLLKSTVGRAFSLSALKTNVIVHLNQVALSVVQGDYNRVSRYKLNLLQDFKVKPTYINTHIIQRHIVGHFIYSVVGLDFDLDL